MSAPVELRIRCAADIVPPAIEWLWDARVPLAALTIVTGAAGAGKTALLAAVAAQRIPGADAAAPARPVFWVHGGGSPDREVFRMLVAAGADLANVRFVEAPPPHDGLWLPEDLALLDRLGVADAILVVDGFETLAGAGRSRRTAAARALARWEERNKCAVVVASERARLPGDDPMLVAAKSALVVAAVHGDPEARTVTVLKASFCRPAPAAAFALEDAPEGGPRFRWLEGPPPMPGEKAMAWLRVKLRPGPVASGLVRAEAWAAGISEGTLYRAKKELGVVVAAGETGPEWSLPAPKTAVVVAAAPAAKPAAPTDPEAERLRRETAADIARLEAILGIAPKNRGGGGGHAAVA